MKVYKDFLLEKNSTYQFLIENNKLNIKTDSAYYYDLNKYFNYYQYGLNSLPFFGEVDDEKIIENTQDHLLVPGAVIEEIVIVNQIYTGISKLKFISPQYFNEQYEEINGMVINNSLLYTKIGKSNYFSFDNTEDNPIELYYTKYAYKKDYEDNKIHTLTNFDLTDTKIYCNQWKKIYDRNNRFKSLNQEPILPFYASGKIKIEGESKIQRIAKNEEIIILENSNIIELEGEFKQFEQINIDQEGSCLRFQHKGIDETEYSTIKIFLENNTYPQICQIKECLKLEFEMKPITTAGNSNSSDCFIFYYNQNKEIINTPHSDYQNALHIINIKPKIENKTFDIEFYTDITLTKRDESQGLKVYLLDTELMLQNSEEVNSSLQTESQTIYLSKTNNQIILKDKLTLKQYYSLTDEISLQYQEGMVDELKIQENSYISPNGYFKIQENIINDLKEDVIITIFPSESSLEHKVKINGVEVAFSKINPLILLTNNKNLQCILEPVENAKLKIDINIYASPEGVKEVNSKMKQYYYKFDSRPDEYVINLELDTYTKIGVQALPNTYLYFNNKPNPIIIGNTGIFEIDLKNQGYINQIKYDGTSLSPEGPTPYLIVDLSE